jgi:hypothetical protein
MGKFEFYLLPPMRGKQIKLKILPLGKEEISKVKLEIHP